MPADCYNYLWVISKISVQRNFVANLCDTRDIRRGRFVDLQKRTRIRRKQSVFTASEKFWHCPLAKGGTRWSVSISKFVSIVECGTGPVELVRMVGVVDAGYPEDTIRNGFLCGGPRESSGISGRTHRSGSYNGKTLNADDSLQTFKFEFCVSSGNHRLTFWRFSMRKKFFWPDHKSMSCTVWTG